MKKELVDQILQGLITTIEKTKDFAMEQAPILAREIISFNMALHLIGIIIGAILSVASYFVIRRAFRLSDDNDADPVIIVTLLGSILLPIAACVFFGINVDEFLKCWLAPRLYLLEYMRAFIK
jgi:hypothetical protein